MIVCKYIYICCYEFMRILTIVSSTLVFLPLLSLNAIANQATTNQESADLLKTEINSTSDRDLTITADNSWSSSSDENLERVRFKLQDIRQRDFTPSRGVPSLTIANPYGFGADRGFYSGLSYQVDTRGGLDDDNDGDASWGFGLGLGNAQKTVGAELIPICKSG